MMDLSSLIKSSLYFCRLPYFHVAFTFHHLVQDLSAPLRYQGVVWVAIFIIIDPGNLSSLLYRYPWRAFTFVVVVLAICDYAVIGYAERQWRWIAREWRYLCAVRDDVSKASRAGVRIPPRLLDTLIAVDEGSDDRTRPLLEKVQQLMSTCHDGRRDFLRRHQMAFRAYHIYNIKNDLFDKFQRWKSESQTDISSTIPYTERRAWSESWHWTGVRTITVPFKFRTISTFENRWTWESEKPSAVTLRYPHSILLPRWPIYTLLFCHQHIAKEDDSDNGSASVICRMAELVSSVKNKVNGISGNPQYLKLLPGNANRKIIRFLWKLTALEAFLKDLGFANLETAIENAWIEDTQVLLRDLDHAIDSFTQSMGITGLRWFSNLDCLKSWPLLLKKMDSVDEGLNCFSEIKHRYGFQFFRRKRRASLPFLVGTIIINQVQTLTGRIHDELNQDPFKSLLQLNPNIYPWNFLEEMRQLLHHEVNEGASNFRLACVEQVRKLTEMVGNETKNPGKHWSDKITYLAHLLYDLRITTRTYGIERPSSMVGLEEDTNKLASGLTSGTEQQFVFSIVGMQGIGKTALAKNVYHHRDILRHFPCRAWVYVPQGSNDVDALLEEVGKQITRIHDPPHPRQGNRRVYWLRQIHNFLQPRRCLVVLDNISTERVWDMLKGAFPASSKSRILLTTRHKVVALHADKNNAPFLLRLRTKEESWSLFNEKACLHRKPLSKEQRMRVEKVLERCWGLPHTISSLALTKDPWWLTPKEKELSTEVDQIIQQHRALWLENISNIALPQDLRAPLSYFTLFPENFKIPVRRLIALWVAEGLVEHSSDGETWLSKLIDLNIIQPVKNDLDGKAKICCLPVPLRRDDMSSLLASSIQQWLANHYNYNEASFKPFHSGGTSPHAEWTRYRNLPFLVSFDTRDGDKRGEGIGNFLSKGIANGCFRKLRVLDLERVFRPQLPNTIGNMEELRYLGLRWTYLEEIPSSIGNLKNLETLDLKYAYIRTLPLTIWNLQKLRHLYFNSTHRSKFARESKTKMMKNLHTLWGVFLDKNSPLKDTIDELESLRKLKSAFQLSEEDQKELAKRIAKLNHLQSLRLNSIDVKGSPKKLHLEDYSGLESLSDMYLFGSLEAVSVLEKLPRCLRDLTLSASGLRSDPMPILGELPNLRSLHLFSNSFAGKRMVCSARKFRKLLVLKLWGLKTLTEWQIMEEAMENLRELEIRSCQALTFPIGLRHLKTLRELKLTHMKEEFINNLEREPVWDTDIPITIVPTTGQSQSFRF